MMKAGYDDFFRKARVNAGVSKESTKARFALGDDPSPRRATGAGASAPGTPQKRAKSVSAADRERLQLLREKVRAGRARKRRKFPFKLVIGSLLGLCAAGVGLQYHEDIDKFLSRVEIGAMNSAVAADKKPAAAAPAAAAVAPSGARAPAAIDPQAARKEWTEDELNHLQKLVQRKEQLDAREAELSRLEAELSAQREEIEKKLKSMDETRAGISNMLQERSTQDAEKVETLVQVYSNMKPANAAKVLESMDEDLAVEIIGRMKKKNAAEVLNLMKPEKAQVFSEKFAGYRKK